MRVQGEAGRRRRETRARAAASLRMPSWTGTLARARRTRAWCCAGGHGRQELVLVRGPMRRTGWRRLCGVACTVAWTACAVRSSASGDKGRLLVAEVRSGWMGLYCCIFISGLVLVHGAQYTQYIAAVGPCSSRTPRPLFTTQISTDLARRQAASRAGTRGGSDASSSPSPSCNAPGQLPGD